MGGDHLRLAPSDVDPRFLAAVFARPPVVLGRQLRPFCCGHAVLLDALESPYIRGGPLAQNGSDLIKAVWICSQTYEAARDGLMRPPEVIAAEAQQWGASMKADGLDVRAEHERFSAYLEEHTRAPKRWKKGDEKAAKSPWPLTIAIGLQRELGWTETRAWNAPLQEALWAFAVISEANGDDSLISEEEEVAAKWAKECREGRADPTRPPWLKAPHKPDSAQEPATGRAS